MNHDDRTIGALIGSLSAILGVSLWSAGIYAEARGESFGRSTEASQVGGVFFVLVGLGIRALFAPKTPKDSR